jgi:sphingolipid delta-4 desaturase
MTGSATVNATDFEWTYTEEPHKTRREAILKAHPEVRELFGHHPKSKYYCAATVALQIFCAVWCAKPETSWLTFFVIAYVVGGTANHSLTLAIHEMSHHLFFKKPAHNVWYSYFANFPLVIPYSASFKKYHLEHHRYQGVDGIDTDIPTAYEGWFFTSPFKKFLWVFLQPFFYAIRPLLVNPKPLDKKDFMNIVTQFSFLYVLYTYAGVGAIGYLLAATLFGLGFHPCAGHFIAEHYTNLSSTRGPHQTGLTAHKKGDDELFPDETFTYRGPLNLVSYYVGIHVAHHDFPFVSGFRLAEVEKMCPEFYEHLPETKSWPGTIYDYIMGDGCPFDRVKRTTVNGGERGEPKKQK